MAINDNGRAPTRAGADTDALTVAVPKGRLLKQLLPIFARADLDTTRLTADDRRLVLDGGPVRFLLSRAADVPTFVEYGAADVGVAGKDVLWESGGRVAELLDLGIGYCEIIVAVPGPSPVQRINDLHGHSRVATKYPRIASRWFREQGLQVDVISLHGNIELAPLVGLADAVVDLSETGQTLRDNDLRPIATIGWSTARLIANPVRYKLRHQHIEAFVQAIRHAL